MPLHNKRLHQLNQDNFVVYCLSAASCREVVGKSGNATNGGEDEGENKSVHLFMILNYLQLLFLLFFFNVK